MDLHDVHAIRGLYGFNWAAAFFHFVGLVTLVIAYQHWNGSKYSFFTLYRYQVEGPPSSGPVNLECELVPPGLPAPTFQFNVLYACMAFFAITVGAHAFYATDAFGTMAYSRALLQGWNPFRWVEYALSASIMIAAIGAADGTVDTPTILLLFTSTMALMFNGYSAESAMRGRGPLPVWATDTVKASMISSWLLFFGSWAVIFYNFGYLVTDVNDLYKNTLTPSGKKVQVPLWLWYVVIAQFTYFLSFGAVQFIQMGNRSMEGYDYIPYERSYIALSFFSKLSLASGLGYGLLWSTKSCNST
jgi:hypothetical protein